LGPKVRRSYETPLQAVWPAKGTALGPALCGFALADAELGLAIDIHEERIFGDDLLHDL
jgi:hypothetical protein